MKKWKNVLWPVLISLFGAGVGGYFLRGTRTNEKVVATVNGEPVTYSEYRTALSGVHATINMIKAQFGSYGIPIDFILNMKGLDHPEQLAFDKCIREKVIGRLNGEIGFRFTEEYYANELIKNLPHYLFDDSGVLKIREYERFIYSLGTTVEEFEIEKRRELLGGTLESIVKTAAYFPRIVLLEKRLNKKTNRKFKPNLKTVLENNIGNLHMWFDKV